MKDNAEFARVKLQVLAELDQMQFAYRDALASPIAIPLPELLAAVQRRIEQPAEELDQAIGMLALLALMQTLTTPVQPLEETP